MHKPFVRSAAFAAIVLALFCSESALTRALEGLECLDAGGRCVAPADCVAPSVNLEACTFAGTPDGTTCCLIVTPTTTPPPTTTTTPPPTTTTTTTTPASFDYVPLENIPGAEGSRGLPAYVTAIYKFALWAVGIAALFMLTLGGFLYLSSAGNNAAITRAKGIIKDSLIALAVALLAYLILYVINPDLVNVSLDSFSRIGGTAPATSTTVDAPLDPATEITSSTYAASYDALPNASTITTGTYPDTWYPDAAQTSMVSQLAQAGIQVKDNDGVTGTAALCVTEGQGSSCTSLYRFPSAAANILVGLANDCRAAKGTSCTFFVTGATEYWKHSKTTKHMPGNPVIDIGKNSASSSFKSYVLSFTPLCTRGGRNVYPVRAGSGIAYMWDEDSSHWHVSLGSNMCQ